MSHDPGEELRTEIDKEVARLAAAIRQPSARANEVGRILRAHLVVEASLRGHLQAANPRLDVENLRLSFDRLRQAVMRLKDFAVPSLDPPIAALNRIRNSLAHRLDAPLAESDQKIVRDYVGLLGHHENMQLEDFGQVAEVFAVTVGMILAAGQIIHRKHDELAAKLALHNEASRLLRELDGESDAG